MAQTATVQWRGAAASAAIKAAAAIGVQKWAEHVLTESNAHVPLDEGTLERSGVVTPTRVDPDTLAAAITYDTPYAVRQHEDLTYRHAPGRGAKYLERALNRTHDEGLALVAREVRRAIGS